VEAGRVERAAVQPALRRRDDARQRVIDTDRHTLGAPAAPTPRMQPANRYLGRLSSAFLASASFWAAACCSQVLALPGSAASPPPPLASNRPSLRCASGEPASAARSYQSAARAPSGVKPALAGADNGS